MKGWAPLALFFAHALASAQADDSVTGTVHIQDMRRKLRLHGTPRRKLQSTPEGNDENPREAADSTLSDDLQQLPSSEMEDDDGTSGGQDSLLQDGALGDHGAGDTELPLDEWEYGPSSDVCDG